MNQPCINFNNDLSISSNESTKEEIYELIYTELNEKFNRRPNTPETRAYIAAVVHDLVRKYTDNIPTCDNRELKIICNQCLSHYSASGRGLNISIIVPPEHILYEGLKYKDNKDNDNEEGTSYNSWDNMRW